MSSLHTSLLPATDADAPASEAGARRPAETVEALVHHSMSTSAVVPPVHGGRCRWRCICALSVASIAAIFLILIPIAVTLRDK